MTDSEAHWTDPLPRVFRHRNYRIFFAGQLVSLMGTWMQAVALGWLVYRLSNSPLLLGVVTFAAQVPIFFISPFAGAIADRFDRRMVFSITQGLCMVQAAVLTVLTLGGWVTVDIVMALSLFFGVVTAVETPARQAFTIEMVGREDLRQAIAYNAMMFNMARTLGPAIGGILVATLGEGLCFLLNTASYAAVLTSLIAMRLERRGARADSHAWDDLKQGFSYVGRHPHIRLILLLSATASCFGTSYLSLMPAFARDVLHEQSDGFGYVMSAYGIGAFIGAAMVSRIHDRHLVMIPTIMAALLGAALICFANATSLPVAMAFIVPSGLAYLGVAVSSNTQIQILSDDSMRGRVMAFYAMGALGSPPLGALFLGYVADHIGVPNAFMLGGALCLIAAAASYVGLKRQRIAGFARDIAE